MIPVPSAVVLALSFAAQATDTVVYEVRFPNATHHETEITVTWSGLPDRPLQVRMSRSSPGRYALHEFAKNVYGVRAVDGRGRALVVTRPEPYQWDVSGHDGTVRLTYTLFADRADGTYSGIDRSHAHLNMPATFLWARGTADQPIRITFHPPPGSGWRIATQLAPTPSPATFTAPHLQYFMDSPTELSDFRLRSWLLPANGRSDTIRIALHHTGTDAEFDAYTEMAKKVVHEQVALFGEPPPFDYGAYTFLADYLPWVNGDGMEHRNSTVLTSTASLAANAIGNLGTLSHEFFHAWNIERLRPRSLEPFDFERANISGELWFAEGFTSYYDDLFLRRAGIIDDDRFVASLAGPLDAVIHGNGRRYFSLVEMSLQSPLVDAALSNDPTNRVNTYISYYAWGTAVALGIDLTLRARFPGKSLDDWMRAMWRKYGKSETPYTLDDLRSTLAEVTGDAAFANDAFARYITGREVMDYAALLAPAGIVLRRPQPVRATLGEASLQLRSGRVTIAAPTLIGSPLYDADLDRGDQILALDGEPITAIDQIAQIAARHRPGDIVEITFLSRGQTVTTNVRFTEEQRLAPLTFERAGVEVTPAIHRFREDWLRSKAGA
jgi:predicted metalloprotease with PDZ domain